MSLVCRRLDADERCVIDTPIEHRGQGVAPRLTYVTRPGLFKLIQRSNKPEARKFDRWVRHEVLPAIMDHGGYVVEGADLQHVAEVTSGKPYNDLSLFKQMADVVEAARARIAELEAHEINVSRIARIIEV